MFYSTVREIELDWEPDNPEKRPQAVADLGGHTQLAPPPPLISAEYLFSVC